MKIIKYIISLCLSFYTVSISAQPIELIAHYPYLEDLADSTDNNLDTFLEGNSTPPTLPSIGVELCQNGIYILNQDGQSIQTPVLNNFDLNNFEMEIEFKPLASVPSSIHLGTVQLLWVGNLRGG